MVKKSLYLSLLLLVSFWAYRDLRFGAFHDDLHDYQQFMSERTRVSSDGEFFWQVLSFDRVREKSSQVNFLFRPGLFSFLAWQDIFYRDTLWLSGAISLLLHGLCVGALFLWLTRTLTPASSFLLVLPFTFFANGSFMILWRMIAPYTIALLFFVAGTAKLFSRGEKDRDRVIAGTLFFLSSLFHESVAFLLPLLGIGAWFLFRKKKPWSYWFAFFFPPFAYFAWSLLDLCLRAPDGGIFSHYFDRLGADQSYSFAFPFLVVVRILQVWGYYVSAFVLPQSVNFPWSVSQPFSLIVGGGLLVLGVSSAKKHWIAIREGHDWAWRWVVLLGYPICLLTMLAIFRVAPLGYFYIGASSYYCYTTAFFLVLLGGAFFPRAMTSGRRIGLTVLALLYLNTLIFGYQRLRKIIAADAPNQKARYEMVERVKSRLKDDDCIAWDAEVPLYLYRQTCKVKPGIPVTYSVLASP